jgi:hypothetical protein
MLTPTDNRTNEEAEWDDELLAAELRLLGRGCSPNAFKSPQYLSTNVVRARHDLVAANTRFALPTDSSPARAAH